MREFTCLDCGAEVVDFAPISANDCSLCGQCRWLRAIPDEEEREALRLALKRCD